MMSTLESLLGFTVAALLYAEGKVVAGGFFFVNCCFISICPPKKVEIKDPEEKKSKKMPDFVFIITTAHIFSLLVVKNQVRVSYVC